jgi:hypothetical protein
VPQRAQHPARTHGVAHGLRDTVPGGHLDVVPPARRGADGYRRGDEARASQDRGGCQVVDNIITDRAVTDEQIRSLSSAGAQVTTV